MTRWIGIAVETSIPWPTADTLLSYRGRNVHLRPATEKTLPMVEMEFEPEITPERAHLEVRRFMSALAWMESSSLRETIAMSGERRMAIGRPLSDGLILSTSFPADELPDATDPKVALALALYREALGLNSVPYQFLGFFKVLNVLNGSGKTLALWIQQKLPDITDHEAKDRLKTLELLERDVAKYLYASGRCAVAHAYSDPVVDPDNPEDERRLKADLPVIKALARHVIENVFGVKSRRAIWREHLYELDGFRQLFGSRAVQVMKSGGTIARSEIPQLPPLSIRIRKHDTLDAFEQLATDLVTEQPGGVILFIQSQSSPLRLALRLSFSEERLGFSPADDVVIKDDGSQSAVQANIDHRRLLLALIKNGELEVWDTARSVRLGRWDPYIPENIDAGRSCQNLECEIGQLRIELVHRTLLA